MIYSFTDQELTATITNVALVIDLGKIKVNDNTVIKLILPYITFFPNFSQPLLPAFYRGASKVIITADKSNLE